MTAEERRSEFHPNSPDPRTGYMNSIHVMGQLKTLGYTILDESLRQEVPLGHEVPPRPSPPGDPGRETQLDLAPP